MAAGDRETTLILKASDLSSQTIEKVLATAAKLLTFQDTLNAKVASGTVKISEFNGSLNNIMQVFTALAQMKLVFPETERLERVVATQKARVEALRAAAAEIEAIPEGERTRKQQSRLDRFTSTELTPAGNPKGTIAKEDARLEQQTARLQRNLDLERAMGVTEENRAALQEQINAGLERHTQELLRAKNAQLEIVEANYREREAQQAIAKAAAEVEAINRRALADTKAQEAALRELTSEANAFDKAMRSAFEAAAKAADRAKGDQFKVDFGDAAYEKAQREKKAADDIAIAQGDAAHEEQQRNAARREAERQAAALEESRRRARQAQSGLGAAPTENRPEDFSSLSASLAGIMSPTAAARETVAGLTEQLNKLAGSLGGDLPKRTSDYQKDLRELGVFMAQVQRQAAQIDQFKKLETEVAALNAQWAIESERLRNLNVRLQEAATRDKDLDFALAQQVKLVASLESALGGATQRLLKTSEALKAAGVDTAQLGRAMEQLTENAQTIGRILPEIEKGAGLRPGEGFTLFGLRPYELQNLGYQINDVVTGFASGQAAMQILAQQGGQIFQLWERQLGAALYNLRQMPVAMGAIGVSVIAVALAFAAFIRAAEEASTRRVFAAQLSLDVDGARLSVERLVESVKSVERLGISFSDAAKGARALAGAGITGPQLEQYLKLAANLSNASGGTLTFAEAIKRVSEAFTGGYQELLKFIEADNSLDANTTKQIKDLAELGKIVEARGVAYTALSHKAEEAANKERGAWSAAFITIKNDWHDLLDLLGDSAVLKAAFGPVTSWLSDWVTSIHEILTATQWLISILPGLPGQKDKAAGPGAAGSTPFSQTDAASLMALKATLEKKLADLQASDTGGSRMLQQSAQLRATDVKTPGYGGEGFAQLRDTAADLLGITRNFAKSLQESEGVWIGSERRWQNAHENDPNSHATGPMQVQPGTFDSLKKQFPELIKGTIDDVWSNLVAGLLYAKQKAVEAGGSPARTTEAYHMGSASTPPDRFATAQGQQVAAGSTEVFATSNIAQTKAALEAVNKALTGTKEASQAAATTGVLDPATLERSKRATQDFVEEMHKDALKMRDPFVMGPDALDRESELLEEFRKDQVKKAQDYAKQHNAIELDMVRVNAAINEQAALKQKEFDDERLKRQIGVSRELNSLNAELAKGDATNIDAQKKTINDRFATLRESIKQQFSGPGAAQTVGGKTFDEVIADINRLEQGEVEQAAAKGWEARVEAVWKKFDEQMKQADTLLQIPGRMADGIKKMQDAVKEFGPGVRSAGEAALTALTKLPDSPAVRAAMERIRTRVAQVDAPGQVRQFTDTAIRTTEQPTTDLIAQRSAEVAAVTARVKAGVITFQDGLREVTDRLAKWLPEMTRAVNQENAALRAINALPTTSETQRAANDKKIADNILALAKAPVAITEFINAGLEDSQKELESLVKRYKDLIAKAVQLQVRGLNAAAQEALAEAEKVRSQIGPARDKLVGNARQAAKTPGLPAGEVASLEERADKAQKEGDPQQLKVDGILAQAKGAEEQIKQFQSSLREHQATEQALLAKGLITQTAYEAEMKRAYEETAAQAAPAIQNLLDLADAAEKAGASASKVAQLRDQAKLLRAELAYVPPLQQQIIQGFEQSFASRGEQAFDAVAKSIGTAIATGGKFKDVLRATGNAFANMAAGILEDVAKIIIKYELLKLVKDALGDSSDLGTGTGNTSSSGTGSATSSAGGVVGLLAKLFGSSSGGAGAAGAFDGAGVAAGTATVGADAGFASEGFMLLAHTGRIVGDPTGMSRPIDLSVFHQAQRMHTGGMVGLAHDEVPMILQKNEEVLSKSDPRNRMNLKAAAGSGGDNGTSIRNVLAVGDKEIASAMNSSHGERVILNVLQRNAPTVKKYVG